METRVIIIRRAKYNYFLGYKIGKYWCAFILSFLDMKLLRKYRMPLQYAINFTLARFKNSLVFPL